MLDLPPCHRSRFCERIILQSGEMNKQLRMSRRRFKLEQIIRMIREAEVDLSHGSKVRDICIGLGISEQAYYSWRREYDGLKVSQVNQKGEHAGLSGSRGQPRDTIRLSKVTRKL